MHYLTSRLTSVGLSEGEKSQAALGMRVWASPLAASACISCEPEECTLPKDKTVSENNTHRAEEGKEHDTIYAMSKLRYWRDEKLGMKPSQSSIVKCSSKGLSFLSKRKEKKRKL